MSALEFPFTAPAMDGELKEVAPGIKWLRMPLPYALDHINLYLVRADGGWMIVDTGLDTETTKTLWGKILARLPAHEPIVGVLCTHSHNDHAGVAGWLTEKLRVPLHMSQGEYFSLRAFAGADAFDSWEYQDFYHQLGFTAEHTETMVAALRKMRLASPVPQSYRRLRHGDTLEQTAGEWRIITGEGHSPEHVSLFSEKLGILICGDQLLPRISANVSIHAAEPESNPLRGWLESLERIGGLPAETLVLPAHDLPYRGLKLRAHELDQHHRKHLHKLRESCARQPGSAFELMQIMFPRRKGRLDDFLAVSECLAHLSWLCAEGQINRVLRDDGVAHYSVEPAAA